MARKRTIVIVLGVALLAAGAGALFVGLGGVPAGADGDEPLTDYPTGTPIDANDTVPTASAGSPSPFSFTIDAIDECGQTCRDVTVTLTNHREQVATDVVVFTRIYAGQDTTASDDRVWEGRATVGTLDAGASHTATHRVELSLAEALQIERADGWVTVVTTVRSTEVTVTFKSTEQVA